MRRYAIDDKQVPHEQTAHKDRITQAEARLSPPEGRAPCHVPGRPHESVGRALALLYAKLSDLQTSNNSPDRAVELHEVRALVASTIEAIRALGFDPPPSALCDRSLEEHLGRGNGPFRHAGTADAAGVRVFVADDHEVFCEGVRSIIVNTVDLTFIGYATNAQRAVEMAAETKPDIVVMNASLPGSGRNEATRKILESLPDTSVICLSIHNDESVVSAAIEAGATGCLLKDCPLEEIVEAIRTVHATGQYFSPSVTSTMIQGYVERVGGRERVGSRVDGLTDRERETLQLISEGLSTKQIAGKLGVSVKTVSTHREHLMQKLDLHSIAGLTKYAIRNGLTTVERDQPV